MTCIGSLSGLLRRSRLQRLAVQKDAQFARRPIGALDDEILLLRVAEDGGHRLGQAAVAEELRVAGELRQAREEVVRVGLRRLHDARGVGAARVCQIKKAALTKARAFMDADAFV